MNERILELAEQAGMSKGQELQIVASGVGVGRSIIMNQRIQELAKQCTYLYESSDGSGEYETFDKEKFAELIVRECANIAHNKQYKHSPAHTLGDCATAIKQHFGVEE